ncbi:hypothetical protein EV121DRAFT_205033 [Schizophyllum commune]
MNDVVRVDPVLPLVLMKCRSGERAKGLNGEEVRTLSGAEVVELLEDEQPHAKAAVAHFASSSAASSRPSSSSHASPSSSSHAPPSTSHSHGTHPTTLDPLTHDPLSTHDPPSTHDPLTSPTSPSHPPTLARHLPFALHEPWALTTALRVPARGLRPTNENRAANVLITHALAVTMRVGVRPGEEVAMTRAASASGAGERTVSCTREDARGSRAGEGGDQPPRRSSEADDRRRSGLNLDELAQEEKLFDVTIRMPVHVYSPLCTPDALCLPMYEEEDSCSSHSEDHDDNERVGREQRHIRRVAEAAAGVVVPWI